VHFPGYRRKFEDNGNNAENGGYYDTNDSGVLF
jgi:hypothetical protein